MYSSSKGIKNDIIWKRKKSTFQYVRLSEAITSCQLPEAIPITTALMFNNCDGVHILIFQIYQVFVFFFIQGWPLLPQIIDLLCFFLFILSASFCIKVTKENHQKTGYLDILHLQLIPNSLR